MQELIDAGLYGKGLICIDDAELIRRYNECLETIGVKKVRRKRICIDRMGWSPEVAASLSNNFYLSRGEANPFAIIITPKQKHAPIYFPCHSFDWELMHQWFLTYEQEVSEITKYTGILLDIDQEVNAYEDERDLIMVDHVIVRVSTPSRLIKEARSQKVLVERFMQERKIIEIQHIARDLMVSRAKIGDMRNQKVFIDDLRFEGLCVYYTRAFGGTFVLCQNGEHASDEYFILNKSIARSSSGIDSVVDKNILSKLESFHLIDLGVTFWIDNITCLELIRDSFLMEHLDKHDPDLNFVELSPALKKGMIAEISSELPIEYHELDILIRFIRSNRSPANIPDIIRPFLMYPRRELSIVTIEVIWHILTLVCDGRNVLMLYLYDKDSFVQMFETWKTPRKTWAIKVIQKYHVNRL